MLKMAIIKKSDIEKLGIVELKEKFEQMKIELNRELASKNVPGKKFNYGKVREYKRTIARVLTKLRALEAQEVQATIRKAEAKGKKTSTSKVSKGVPSNKVR